MNHKYVPKISKANHRYIKNISQNGETPTIRTRASALLLSAKRYTINGICDILDVERHSVSRWIKNWESNGRDSLKDKKRTGRNHKLTSEEEILAKELVDKNSRRLNKVIEELKKKTGKEISLYTLKRIIKRLGKRWKRMRRSLKGKRNESEFKKAKKEIQEFEAIAHAGGINVVYFDGSNFNMLPNIPYAWQDIGSENTLLLPSERSESISVLGFLDIIDNKLTPFIIDGTLTGEKLVGIVNAFLNKMTEPTILIWDNAPAHTSNEVANHIEEWANLGLFIYSLPPYSPELNKIEILWREMKYNWLPDFFYDSIELLAEAVEKILSFYNTEDGYSVNYS
jgi:prepilin-type processing-associated H-X9-DG protein